MINPLRELIDEVKKFGGGNKLAGYLNSKSEAIADLVDEAIASHENCKEPYCYTCKLLVELTEGK